MPEISWVAEDLLAFQKGAFYTQLVCLFVCLLLEGVPAEKVGKGFNDRAVSRF